jgi:hypothetical protein
MNTPDYKAIRCLPYLRSTKLLLVQHQDFTSVAPSCYLSSTKSYLRSTKIYDGRCSSTEISAAICSTKSESSGFDLLDDHVSENPLGRKFRQLGEDARRRSRGEGHSSFDDMPCDTAAQADDLLVLFRCHNCAIRCAGSVAKNLHLGEGITRVPALLS